MLRNRYVLALIIVFFLYLWFAHDKAVQTVKNIDIRNVVGSLAKHPTLRYSTRLVTSIRMVVVHHSAGFNGSPEQFARQHVDEYNWPGIGYHFVVAKDGTIYQTNDLTTKSYHARDANGYSVGVCCIGNFEIESPTEAQLSSLAALIPYLNTLLVKKLEIVGHGSAPGNSTECPGRKMNVAALTQKIYA